ncbi:MAG: glycosyltransferase family 2 protein [Chloroflexota bacterium]|nr:glycosyltransferase family 2 protein [Chloroflexota bacterium]
MITSLQACDGFAESPVYVFADGPRYVQDVAATQEARAEARRLLGDDAIYLERDTNLGIEISIINGVTQLCDKHGAAVVVEDDLVFSPHFLKFLNMGLKRYEDQPRVMQVCGYMFDVPQFRGRNMAMLLPMPNSWGWATWKRAWDQFDPLATGWRERLRDDRDRRRFDLDGHFKYARMLSHHMSRSAPAWDIRWYYSVFSRDGLALYPPRTLVLHTGFDGTGTHDRFALPVHQAELETNAAFDLPTQLAEDPEKGLVFDAIGRFRPSSNYRKAIALARFMLRRAAPALHVPRLPRKKPDPGSGTGEQQDS